MFFKRKPPSHRHPLQRRVRDLEVVSARLIRAGFAGDYHSAFHGRGIEFSQVREYLPGDDVRAIDWNVTARSGVPHVKEFVEERDLTILVAVDVSGSMAFGSIDWRKVDIAAELAAVFAFSAVQNSDRVGLLLFADTVRTFLPPRRGRSHAQVIVRGAVDAAMRGCSGSANFETAVMFLDRVAVKRAVVVVIATQNPIEHEGTYALPEAQVDRFIMKLKVDYPTAEEELRMLGLYLDPIREAIVVRPVIELDAVQAVSQLAARVHVDERIGRYIVALVAKTREPSPHVSFGASPRATLALAHVAKAHAFIGGRAFVVPEDVKAIAHDVLRHRLVLSYEAAAENVTADRIVEQVLSAVAVP